MQEGIFEMGKKYLLLDCNYLCHRAKHTTGSLSYGGNVTGVIYGFLKSLGGFQDLFNTSNFVFCWDSNTSKRKELYPEYKAKRLTIEQEENMSEEEIQHWEFETEFRRQIKKLRTTYLRMIGFSNIFIQRGYESDDIIASISRWISANENLEAIIISSDKDLYQCISHNVSFYNPQRNKILTLQGFKKQYGIKPIEWAMMKAIAGCPTDNIRGVGGVGEKTALKYIRGELKSGKKYNDIKSENGWDIYNRNIRLVHLPLKGTQKFKLEPDKLSEQGWKRVIEMLGMKSIRDRMPFGRRK